MTDRWKMNRIGFVNFWLYDEEDFEFIDGKLLLRGQNGSGKSITTQSFIPFVLDGDRTPSRLDPFGSSDRRMEYYFLGEEGREEATGYLFLEFKKERTEEYRTIGIGQRAKRGKPMDFWGFIILDGRRIGCDLWLYKEVGTTKFPYDKREMKAQLGEGNFFTDSQSEYKKHVNQYIFGFRKADQYEQFIKLLVKVRAPKLSKEFKPTKVYEILNDSLQTLTDEDLRAMVDAMEKMDEIQDSLDMLRRAFADIKVIRTEYTRYNQYMIAKKAQAYIAKKREVEDAKSQLEAQEQSKIEMESDLRGKTIRRGELEEKRNLAEIERIGLLDTDLEEMDRKLEQARKTREELETQETKWENKIEECGERIREGERKLKEIQDRLELRQQELQREKRELEEQQEVLRWDQHQTALQLIACEEYAGTDEIVKNLDTYKKLIQECKKAIQRYEEISGQYDELAGRLEQTKRQKILSEQELEGARDQVTNSIDQWIVELFHAKETSLQWNPVEEALKAVEERVQNYRSVKDAGAVQEILRADYERQRQALTDAKSAEDYALRQQKELLREAKEELTQIQNREEMEPEREESARQTRLALQKAGIKAVPFYKTVEFANGMDSAACARLEAQLQKMGLLDALVVSAQSAERIRQACPQFLDTVLYVEKRGDSHFSGLTVSEEAEDGIREMVDRILSNIYEKDGGGNGVYLAEDGSFRQGILTGRADKTGAAEYVGLLARKRRKEEKIRQLEEQIQVYTETVADAEKKLEEIEGCLNTLREEYLKLPDFSGIDEALEQEKLCTLEWQAIKERCDREEKQEQSLARQKNEQYQNMLRKCRSFPYARTKEAYEEVSDAIEEYQRIWQEIRNGILRLSTERVNRRDREEQLADHEQAMDDAIVEKRGCSARIKECELRIRQCEDYLNRPENIEKANRLNEIREELSELEKERDQLNGDLVRLEDGLLKMQESLPKLKERLQQLIGEETFVRNYFEEELSLKLVLERGERTLFDCAREAAGVIREGDKNRESGEMLNALFQVYQGHNGSLTSYGTALEDCFGTADDMSEIVPVANALRKRVCVVSVWNGKKVYLEEFYGILKAAIDETELLIQKKDRELFEDILSRTISRQLTDRIEESRKWVLDMSRLMKAMDTSMGLSFSLEWKPRKAENDTELDTAELEQILLRDRALLTMEDIEKVAAHFRSKIRTEKRNLEEDGSVINYMELVRDALDYRKWFEFQMFFRRGDETKKALTNAAFNRFSGGEKAMAMYVPLFAAVNAQYQKADNKDHPRIIALDEAFAGVDDKNISSMFELVHKLDFDYIMNSQALWGCFETVKGLRIAELQRPQNSPTVSAIRYSWNGHERILDEQ
ncbi:MAG: TIGR02680 family protein [Acetatifactor muris]|nr:TIGR02680 family protein [Acetatifactor muris]